MSISIQQKQEYFNILGINYDANLEEIKRAYHNLAQQWHPDKWANKPEAERKAAEEKFKNISVAYHALKEELEKESTNNSPKPDPSDPNFWTEPISLEEREKTSEEVIHKLELRFASRGVTSDELFDDPEGGWMLFIYADWRDLMRNCFDRGEFNYKYNLMFDMIDRAAARKKNKNYSSQNHGKEKKTEKGFATKEEADEYGRQKQAEDEALNEKKKNLELVVMIAKRKTILFSPSQKLILYPLMTKKTTLLII